MVVIVDRVPNSRDHNHTVNVLYFSSDEGKSWSDAVITPLRGAVPDKLLELDNGRWIISAFRPCHNCLTLFCRYSDDKGATWSDEIILAQDSRYNLCEVSMLPLGEGKIVAFMRENSGLGYDCMKSISYDNGETWSEVINFPLPGCHRPVSGLLKDGSIFITYRFMQGGKGWLGAWTQNFFGALTDIESALALHRNDACTRIIPLDYDRSVNSDLGYSGWVQFPDGEIYIVNYIADDAFDKTQIRGYSMRIEDFIISGKK
jgi:sialidase-1